MSQNDQQQYHESAITYNKELADFTDGLVDRVPHEEVKKWVRAVGKQHRFHEKRHQVALDKHLADRETGVATEIQHADELTIISPTGTPEVVEEKQEVSA